MLFIILSLLLLSISFGYNITDNEILKSKPTTVSSLDVNKYIGLWYQMYADQIVYSTFEKDSYCSTAKYGLNEDNTISVHNYATIGSPNGNVYTIDGYAYNTDPSQPGQLKVHFDSSDAAPFDAAYWVLALGPEVNNQYSWAVVSDNLSQFLFILARDVNTFKTTYETEVLSLVNGLGFTGFKKPIATYQESDCVYEATLRQKHIKSQN
jgi:lipocalin